MDSSNLGAFLLIFRSAWGSSWKLSCSNASRAFLWRLRLAASSNTLFCCKSLILPRIFETMLFNGSWLLIKQTDTWYFKKNSTFWKYIFIQWSSNCFLGCMINKTNFVFKKKTNKKELWLSRDSFYRCKYYNFFQYSTFTVLLLSIEIKTKWKQQRHK